MMCDWCGLPGADTRVEAYGEAYGVHAACADRITGYLTRARRSSPRTVPWSSVPPQRASGYRPTGGRGAQPVDAVIGSRRLVPDDVPLADVIDAVGRGGRR